jgi:hypothetical protein
MRLRFVLLVALPILVASSASADLLIERGVIAGGALVVRTESTILRSTLAQSGIGLLGGGDLELGLGFWYGRYGDPTDGPENPIPAHYAFPQNYPNPFNPSTTFRLALPEDSSVKVALYDVRGRQLRILIDDYLGAGWHDLQIDLSDLSSGVYWARIHASDFKQTRKLLLIK